MSSKKSVRLTISRVVNSLERIVAVLGCPVKKLISPKDYPAPRVAMWICSFSNIRLKKKIDKIIFCYFTVVNVGFEKNLYRSFLDEIYRAIIFFSLESYYLFWCESVFFDERNDSESSFFTEIISENSWFFKSHSFTFHLQVFPKIIGK